MKEYDIALSFAGEDRRVALELARRLKSRGIRVFYDHDEQGQLWGKHLGEELQSIYRDRSRYCVPLISKHYKVKIWPIHEFRQALDRATRERREYLLPIRLDRTRIAGLSESVGYIDLAENGLDRICDWLQDRLTRRSRVSAKESASVGRSRNTRENVEVFDGPSHGPLAQHLQPSRLQPLLLQALRLLVNDQFENGAAAGGWSRSYGDYIRDLYGSAVPLDSSVRDTITYSAWISATLRTSMQFVSTSNLRGRIQSSLDAYGSYLLRHQDYETGGFGLTVSGTSREPSAIRTDLRHTCWAMMSLAWLRPSQAEDSPALPAAAAYVRSRLTDLDVDSERAITLAVLHRLLSQEETGALTIASLSERHRLLKKLEKALADKYSILHGTWDADKDPVRTVGIDNALFVLYTVSPLACLQSAGRDLMRAAGRNLLLRHFVELPGDQGGIPFAHGLRANPGATALLAWIFLRDGGHRISKRLTDRMINFVAHPGSIRAYAPPVLPWQMTGLLNLAMWKYRRKAPLR